MTSPADKLRQARALIEDPAEWERRGILGALTTIVSDARDRRLSIRLIKRSISAQALKVSDHKSALLALDGAIAFALVEEATQLAEQEQ